jgi:hypothetical protein
MPEPEWYLCEVVRTGPAVDSETMNIRLRELNGKFTGARWFPAAASVKKEMLATALTAITTGLPVNAYLTSPVQYEGTVLRLYISRED